MNKCVYPNICMSKDDGIKGAATIEVTLFGTIPLGSTAPHLCRFMSLGRGAHGSNLATAIYLRRIVAAFK